MLTQRQKEVLEYIRSYIQEHEYGPTLDEISRALNMGSASAAYQHVEILRKKGFLKKLPYQARSISVFEQGEDVVEVPLLGAIALGEPIENFTEPEPIQVPRTLICGSGDHYALVARGNSMKEDGILDGDMLVIKHTNVVDNGDTVVALLEEKGATLKRFFDHGEKIELRPANKSHGSQFYPRGMVEIQGKFCGLIRKG